MRSFWFDPYLWIHLAGLATLPIWLELCLLGLAVGDPLLPTWLELGLVGAVGVVPILWMQLQRPFSIFSLVAVALKPDQLSEEQRKLLTLFKSRRNQVLAVVAAIALLIGLQKLYVVAPIAATVTPLAPDARLLGLVWAAIAFLGANLFLQVPLSVLSVLLTSNATFAATLPYATDQIRQNFTLLGLPVNQILPPVLVSDAAPVQSASATPFQPRSTPTAAAVAADIDPWETPTAAALDQPNENPHLASTAAATESAATQPDETATAAASEASAVDALPADAVDPPNSL